MAECEEESNANHPVSQPLSLSLPFVEVVCKSSGLNRRFAAGTEAGFAVNLINRKISTSGGAVPLALHIEALKEGEEPVSFGPNSILVDYGHGWKLQTVTETQGLRSGKYIRMTRQQDPAVKVWISKLSPKNYALLQKPVKLSMRIMVEYMICIAIYPSLKHN
ncbi:hypothetical protein RJ639_013466 [Escallonia herrerae]|uniref:Uncharacterized protein n=1 Tax=Escallonia herrerae TaxID=1293975 RepID=A0AA88VFT3_9ASTE|nr:hypothetical protein RJ639_013466 [Escallonia herrerae]